MAAAGMMSSIRRQEDAPIDGGAELGGLGLAALLGIFTCSMAITLAMRNPPPGLNNNAYFLALASAFFAGMAGVVATVCVSDNNPRARSAAGSKLMHAAIGPFGIVAGLSTASLLYW